MQDLPEDILRLILSHVSDNDAARNCSRVCSTWKELVKERGYGRLPLKSDLDHFELGGQVLPMEWLLSKQKHSSAVSQMRVQAWKAADTLDANVILDLEKSLADFLSHRAPRLTSAVLYPSWLPFCGAAKLLGTLRRCQELRHLELSCWLDEEAIQLLPVSLISLSITFNAGLEQPHSLANLKRLVYLKHLEVYILDHAIGHLVQAGSSSSSPQHDDFLLARISMHEVLASICAFGAGLPALTLHMPLICSLWLPWQLQRLSELKKLCVHGLFNLDNSAVSSLLALPQLETLELLDVRCIYSTAIGLRQAQSLQSLALSGQLAEVGVLSMLLRIPQLTTIEYSVCGWCPRWLEFVVQPHVLLRNSRLQEVYSRLEEAPPEIYESTDPHSTMNRERYHLLRILGKYSVAEEDDDRESLTPEAWDERLYL